MINEFEAYTKELGQVVAEIEREAHIQIAFVTDGSCVADFPPIDVAAISKRLGVAVSESDDLLDIAKRLSAKAVTR